MKTDWEAFSNGSLWCSVVDSVECCETFLWKLLIAIRKNYIILPCIGVTGMFLSKRRHNLESGLAQESLTTILKNLNWFPSRG